MRATRFLAISLILHGIIIGALIALEKKSPNVTATNDTIESYLVLAPIQPATQPAVTQQDVQ
ncbi:hypothetical protein [Alteromonas sp. KUL49]|uniref:hypothetical protein n=1 Tax=Alteromonas sp. KUL49 TaxID=2480798 RepID=UPI00102F27EE|nr:hypothetical protein [Alteromonas sp. KUL49]TAP35820.1 hypothetical protein EYS00_17595 [Alteromonas sp. KUL49]